MPKTGKVCRIPELPQTTYSGSGTLAAAPCALANDAEVTPTSQSSILNAATAAQIETLAGGIVSAFGSFAGNAAGVMASFAGLLRNIGYAGALPYSV